MTPAIAALMLLLASPALAQELANPLTDSPTWEELRGDITGEAPIADGATLFTVEAPYRAHDAATVPVVIRQTDPARQITGLQIVIDENPAPLAAEFSFGPAMAPLEFETRVRVNQYSNLRVIAQTPEGLAMTGRFVKASGGCSAPASKDPAQALAGLGQMKLRLFEEPPAQMSTTRREAQIMIRHPNYSGLQRDQITQLFIAAQFIDHLELWQGEDRLFSMEGGISISENPVFRFAYTDNGAPEFRVVATDTEGNRFEETLPKPAGG